MTQTGIRPLHLFLIVAALWLVGAQAQDNVVISPQSIVVNPKASFALEVWVDKDRSGDATPSYRVGEGISIGVRVSDAAYIYLFNVRSSGEITQILPNRYDQAGQNNYLQAGETKTFPPRGANYTFDVQGPAGLDKVIAVASKEQLDTRQLADFTADPNFASSRQSQESFAQALSIVVRPKAESTWVTDTALFYVGSAPSTPAYGTLDIRSSPSGAAAYVDGQFVGTTPVRFGTTAGAHTVRLELSGQGRVEQRVTLQGGATQRVDLRLSAQTPPPTPTSPPAPPVAVSPPPVVVGGSQMLSDALGLAAPAGTRVLRLDQRPATVRADLETSMSLPELWQELNRSLSALGWQLANLDRREPSSRFIASYRREGGRRLTLDVDMRGQSGRATVTLEF